MQKYNGGIASYAIWLPEFTKFIQLYLQGKSIKNIKDLSDKENIFNMSTKSRAQRCSRNLAIRVQNLPQSIIELYPNLDTNNQKLIALISVMRTSRLLSEFIYDVYRPKRELRDETLKNYEIENFLNDKRIESEEVSNWSLNTIKRLNGALKTYLRDAGLAEIKNRKENILIFPFIDFRLKSTMKKEKMDYELAALGEN